MIKNCNACNKKYNISPYRENITKYCSIKCIALSKSKKATISFKCPTCKRNISRLKSYGKKYSKSYCSNKCSGYGKRVTEEEALIRIRNNFHTMYTIDKNGCWIWNKGKDKDGYGKISYSKKHVRAHRLAYQLFVGLIKPHQLACHSCDQPPCVNPKHLFAGSAYENTKDSIKKERHTRRGEKNGRATLTDDIVRQIKKLVNNNISIASIAEKFDTKKYLISFIKNGKTWKHV